MMLLLFTTSYPYVDGGEKNFVDLEAAHLVNGFGRVVVVPERRAGTKTKLAAPLEVEDGLAEFLRSHGTLSTFQRGLGSGLVLEEIRHKPWVLPRPSFAKHLVFSAGIAELTAEWLESWLPSQGAGNAECLAYSYWFNDIALGLAEAKRSMPGLKVVTRAHRYDLYEEVNTPAYWACREQALAAIDAVYAVSDHGTNYLRSKYPQFASKIETSRLGIPAHGIRTSASADGVFRILSCSKLIPVKRLDLLSRGIATAARRRPWQRMEWRHMGTGAMRGEVAARMSEMPENVSACLLSYTDQAALFEHYRTHAVDVFLNVSASEGTPVSIMEAISCGVPVIATAVGGNNEIVSHRNGILMSADPTADEIADALLAYLDDPGDKRAGSLEVWREKYDAKRNYAEFVRRLLEVRAQR